uniref:Uncharacterized protein n=1 Tax=Falco tinnunculus TaxID=100819 RepID=A0A8C4TWG2_FALTI
APWGLPAPRLGICLPHAPFADAGKFLLLSVPWVTCDFSASSSRIPAGAFLMVLQKFAGETLQERRNRERTALLRSNRRRHPGRTGDGGRKRIWELLNHPQISVASSYKVF